MRSCPGMRLRIRREEDDEPEGEEAEDPEEGEPDEE